MEWILWFLIISATLLIFIILIRKLPHSQLSSTISEKFDQIKELKERPKARKRGRSNLEEIKLKFKEGDLEEAEKALIDFLLENPKNSEAYNLLGIIYLEKGNYADAIDSFNQALKHDPKNSSILNNLGLAFYHQGKYNKAIEYYEKAIKKDELKPSRYINLALAFEKMHDYTKAKEALQKALVLKKGDKKIEELLLEIERKLKNHRLTNKE